MTAISSDTCTETDMEGLCMKKTCEDNWEKGLREEAEGLFQINSFNASDASLLKLNKMKWQYFLRFRWS